MKNMRKKIIIILAGMSCLLQYSAAQTDGDVVKANQNILSQIFDFNQLLEAYTIKNIQSDTALKNLLQKYQDKTHITFVPNTSLNVDAFWPNVFRTSMNLPDTGKYVGFDIKYTPASSDKYKVGALITPVISEPVKEIAPEEEIKLILDNKLSSRQFEYQDITHIGKAIEATIEYLDSKNLPSLPQAPSESPAEGPARPPVPISAEYKLNEEKNKIFIEVTCKFQKPFRNNELTLQFYKIVPSVKTVEKKCTLEESEIEAISNDQVIQKKYLFQQFPIQYGSEDYIEYGSMVKVKAPEEGDGVVITGDLPDLLQKLIDEDEKKEVQKRIFDFVYIDGNNNIKFVSNDDNNNNGAALKVGLTLDKKHTERFGDYKIEIKGWKDQPSDVHYISFSNSADQPVPDTLVFDLRSIKATNFPIKLVYCITKLDNQNLRKPVRKLVRIIKLGDNTDLAEYYKKLENKESERFYVPAELVFPFDIDKTELTFGHNDLPHFMLYKNEGYIHGGWDIFPRSNYSKELLDAIAINYGVVVEVQDKCPPETRYECGYYGNYVKIKHMNEEKIFYSVYGHLASVIVKPEDQVIPGQKIGVMGRTGIATAIHCHFSILNNVDSWNDSKDFGDLIKEAGKNFPIKINESSVYISANKIYENYLPAFKSNNDNLKDISFGPTRNRVTTIAFYENDTNEPQIIGEINILKDKTELKTVGANTHADNNVAITNFSDYNPLWTRFPGKQSNTWFSFVPGTNLLRVQGLNYEALKQNPQKPFTLSIACSSGGIYLGRCDFYLKVLDKNESPVDIELRKTNTVNINKNNKNYTELTINRYWNENTDFSIGVLEAKDEDEKEHHFFSIKKIVPQPPYSNANKYQEPEKGYPVFIDSSNHDNIKLCFKKHTGSIESSYNFAIIVRDKERLQHTKEYKVNILPNNPPTDITIKPKVGNSIKSDNETVLNRYWANYETSDYYIGDLVVEDKDRSIGDQFTWALLQKDDYYATIDQNFPFIISEKNKVSQLFLKANTGCLKSLPYTFSLSVKDLENKEIKKAFTFRIKENQKPGNPAFKPESGITFKNNVITVNIPANLTATLKLGTINVSDPDPNDKNSCEIETIDNVKYNLMDHMFRIGLNNNELYLTGKYQAGQYYIYNGSYTLKIISKDRCQLQSEPIVLKIEIRLPSNTPHIKYTDTEVNQQLFRSL